MDEATVSATALSVASEMSQPLTAAQVTSSVSDVSSSAQAVTMVDDTNKDYTNEDATDKDDTDSNVSTNPISTDEVSSLTSVPSLKPRDSTHSTPEVAELSQPLETFTCFGKLPPELRLKIWKEAADEPQVFLFQPGYSFGLLCTPPWPLPHVRSILFVNRESRMEALRSYPLLAFQVKYLQVSGLRSSWDVYFNSEVDTLALTDNFGPGEFFDFGQGWQRNQKELEKIKRVAFNVATLGRCSCRYQREHLPKIYQALPSLREVTLRLHSVPNSDFIAGKFKMQSEDQIAQYRGMRGAYIGLHKEALNLCEEAGVWKNGRPTVRVIGPA